jgi:hypothetical protein
MGENFVNKPLHFKTLFIGVIFILAGCKKDDPPSSPPSIDIMLPVENTVHNVFDTIEVKFSVQDNDRLSSVTVSLVDLNSQPVMPSVDVTPSSASATITMNYVLYDIHVASGYYYIKVHASDGSAGNTALRKIYVNEAPKMLKNAYIISQPSSSYPYWHLFRGSFAGCNFFLVPGFISWRGLYRRCDLDRPGG